jgi:acetyltransferase
MTSTPAPALYRIRPIEPHDLAALTRFYAGLSADSRESRFHGAAPTIPDGTARFFCGPDHEHREGIVAESFDPDGTPAIIGHVCIEPIDARSAEVAIAVADAWQHHGVGRAMLGLAVDWARTHDLIQLVAALRCGNSAMFALLRTLGQPTTYGPVADGIVDAVVDVRSVRPAAA